MKSLEITKMSNEIIYNNLTYYYKNQKLAPINFIGFRGLMHIYSHIKSDESSREEIEKDQKILNWN